MAIQTLILEPNLLQRRLLIEFLARQPGMALVGVASTLEETLALCRSRRPDLVVAGLGPALSHGLETIREIKECQPRALILVLLDMDDEHHRDPCRRGDDHAVATRLGEAPAILALVVDLEVVVGVLDDGHSIAPRLQLAH